ncbi:MAG: DUF4286 family protein [Bacteroidota bacterium]
MIVYNVTVNVDDDIHLEWLEWMKSVHIPDVLRTGMFIDNRILKLLVEEETGGQSYAIQYTCLDMDTFKKYEKEFAPSLRDDVNKRYSGKFVAFRTLLEVI